MHPINKHLSGSSTLDRTVFLQMMLQLANVYYLMFNMNFTSLNTFLLYVWDITSVFIPIHFFCHANKIVAVNSKHDEIIKNCSINNLKMSIEIIFRIFLVILMGIITTFIIVHMAIINEDIN